MTLIVFVLILSLLILVHELGHYLVARKNGIRVEEFGLGLPPRVIGKKIGETIYSLNLLPFGGFVKLTGEDLLEQDTAANDPRSFASKSVWQRAAVLVAGVTMNLILAVVFYYLLLGFNGLRAQNLPLLFEYSFPFGNEQIYDTVVTGLAPESSFSENSVIPGEVIVSVDGIRVGSVTEVREQLQGKVGQQVEVTLFNPQNGAGQERTLTVVPEEDEEGNGILGVFLGRSVTLSYDKGVQPVLSGFLHSFNMLAYSRFVFAQLIGASLEMGTIQPVSEGVSGPVGIYSVVGNILEGGGPVLWTLVDFIALMSLSLAILNIMPFPALDGGRLVFVLIEKVRGKRINPVLEANIHKWGIMALLGLILLVSIKDVIRFF